MLSKSQETLHDIKVALGLGKKSTSSSEKVRAHTFDGKIRSTITYDKSKSVCTDHGRIQFDQNSPSGSRKKESNQAVKNDQAKRSSLGSATAYSPLIARKDLASQPFFIPPGYTPGSIDLGHLDLAHYRCQEDDESEARQRRHTGGPLGHMDLVLRYSQSQESLAVTVHDLSKFLLPNPSVMGNRWNLTPVVTVSLLPDKRKFFELKHQLEIKDDTAIFLNIRNNELYNKTLRLTVFDSRRRIMHLPVGHVLVPLKELDPSGRIQTFSKPINCYSEPSGFNKGKMQISVNWVGSAEKLEIKICKAYNLKSPSGILGRDFFVKLFVYIGDHGLKTHKTIAKRATPDVDFNEKFVISLTFDQLKDSAFLFCLYAKHLVKLTITSEFIGSTVIGPYMSNRNKIRSQWENIIMSPFEEVTEAHTLYV